MASTNRLTRIIEFVNSKIRFENSPRGVSRADVSDALAQVVDLAKLPLANIDHTYSLGVQVKDADDVVYICKIEGVNGDITNQTNWRRVTGGTSNEDVNSVEEVLPVTTNGQTVFNLSYIPANINKVELFLNGQKLRFGTEFTVSSLGVLTYNYVLLNTSSELITQYKIN